MSRGYRRRSIVGIVAAGDGEVPAGIHDFLELLADLEERKSLRGHRHRLTGSRISTAVRLVGSNREAAEASDLDAFSALQRFGHGVEQAIDYELRAGLRQVPPRSDGVDKFALRHAVLPGRPHTIWLSSHRKRTNVNAFSVGCEPTPLLTSPRGSYRANPMGAADSRAT